MASQRSSKDSQSSHGYDVLDDRLDPTSAKTDDGPSTDDEPDTDNEVFIDGTRTGPLISGNLLKLVDINSTARKMVHLYSMKDRIRENWTVRSLSPPFLEEDVTLIGRFQQRACDSGRQASRYLLVISISNFTRCLRVRFGDSVLPSSTMPAVNLASLQ